MFALLLTPSSLTYLAILIQSIVFSWILTTGWRHAAPLHSRLLAAACILLTFSALMLGLEAAWLYRARLWALALQIPLFAALLVMLLQFTAVFPAPITARRTEMSLLFVVTLLYALWEWGFALVRLWQLTQGTVWYRPEPADAIFFSICLLVPISLLRQYALRRPPGARGFLQHARHSREDRALLSFALLTTVSSSAAIINLLRPLLNLSDAVTSTIIAQILLFSTFAFIISYVNSQAEMTSFVFKIVGLLLTTVLGLFASLAWLPITSVPQTAAHLRSGSALQWQPNQQGGYDVTTVPYVAQAPRGTRYSIDNRAEHHCGLELAYPFTYYGRTYTSLAVCVSGTLSFGGPLNAADYQIGNGAGRPLLMPLLLDFTSAADDGAILYDLDATSGVLRVRWYNLLSANSRDPSDIELQLAPDGTFTMIYHHIGAMPPYQPGDSPFSGRWAVGAVPDGATTPQQVVFDGTPIRGTAQGLLHDYWLDYRRMLHRQVTPIAWATLIISDIVLILTPLILRRNLLQPLKSLLDGVRRLQQGDYTARIPPAASDEIGFLIQAFNDLTARLADQVTSLESRVKHRTQALDDVNSRLKREMQERLDAQTRLLQQQRELAALEERMRLSRDLHDSLGQSFASVKMQADVAAHLLARGEPARAAQILTTIIDSAHYGQAEVRRFTVDIHVAGGFHSEVQRICRQSALSTSARVTITGDDSWDDSRLTVSAETNLLRIVQEAVNNAIRHAAATRIDVDVAVTAQQLVLSVHDDGRGFDATQPVAHGHYGLQTMRERAEELGALFQLTSAAGCGCQVQVSLDLLLAQQILSTAAGPLLPPTTQQ